LTTGFLLLSAAALSAAEVPSPTVAAQQLDAQQWTNYDWNAAAGKNGAALFEVVSGTDGVLLEIIAETPNDARFVHELVVEPDTVYRFACQAYSENIGSAARGAGISFLAIQEGSPDIKGSTSEWQLLELYGKTGPDQQRLSLTVGIGGYGSLNSGLVRFKDIRVEKIENPPTGIRIAALQPPAAPATIPGSWSRAGGYVIAALGILGLLLAVWGRFLRRRSGNAVERRPTGLAPAPALHKIDRADLAVMTALSAVCLLFSVYNLGDHVVPETGWQAQKAGESVTIELGREADLSRIYYYCGINARSGDGSRFTLSARNPVGDFVTLTSFTKNDVGIWKFSEVSVRTDAVRLTADTPGGRLNEIALVERESQTPLTGLRIVAGVGQGKPENLIDEQSSFEYAPSFRTGFYFDEVYHARSAWEMLNRIEPFETTHPPLGKLLISSGIALFGMNPFGWRIVGTLFGVALVPLIYLFALKLFRNRFYAFSAAFLLLVEFMRFAQSRVAVIDVFAVFFILVMYYFLLDLFPEPGTPPRRSVHWTLFFAGIAFGIGAACKWITLYAGCGMLLLVALRTITELRRREYPTAQGITGFLLRRMGVCLMAFGVIPALIYLLAYLPFLALPGPGHGLMDIFRLQAHMFHYHQTLQATHPFSSPWWSWPLDLYPMWMYTGTGLPAGTASTIASFGNPAIFWPGLVAVAATAWHAVRRRDVAMGVVLTALVCQYLPWIGINRLAFIYHFFSTVPFVILCIVATLRSIELRYPRFRAVTWGYLGVAATLFILFYPVLSGLQVPQSYVAALRWLPTWLF
jgi:predicted membrane-bound dolichyl-phosphate-mannose-protein mannosyltransferase